jgi:hypothetical protein
MRRASRFANSFKVGVLLRRSESALIKELQTARLLFGRWFGVWDWKKKLAVSRELD